jgi:hypothetical protein
LKIGCFTWGTFSSREEKVPQNPSKRSGGVRPWLSKDEFAFLERGAAELFFEAMQLLCDR